MKDLKVAMGEKIIWTIILSTMILVTTLLSAEFVDYSYPLLTKNINKTQSFQLTPNAETIGIYGSMFQLLLHDSAAYNNDQEYNCIHLQTDGGRSKYTNEFYMLKKEARIYIKERSERKSVERTIKCVSTYTADEFNAFELDYIGGWVLISIQLILYVVAEVFLWLKCTGCFSCGKKKQYEKFDNELTKNIL